MSLIACPQCGNQVSEHASACPKCGYELNTTICPECGATLIGNPDVCSECGYPLALNKDEGKKVERPDLAAGDEPKLSNSKTSNPKSRKAIIIVIACVLIVGALAVCAVCFGWFTGHDSSDDQALVQETATNSTATPTEELSSVESNDDWIEEEINSVVKIVCYDIFDNEICSGSGFFYNTGLEIVTNYHVVEHAYRAVVVTEDNRSFEVRELFAFSEELDIAVLSGFWNNPNIKCLESASFTTLSKGDDVVAIGSPLGLKNTVSKGTFSGTVDEGDITKIQFTAAISNGSSGGALFNSEGKVIGVTSESFIYGQNMNLAIPIEVVDTIINNTDNPDLLEYFYRERYPDEAHIGEIIKDAKKTTFEYLKEHPEEFKNTPFELDGLYVWDIGEASFTNRYYEHKGITDYTAYFVRLVPRDVYNRYSPADESFLEYDTIDDQLDLYITIDLRTDEVLTINRGDIVTLFGYASQPSETRDSMSVQDAVIVSDDSIYFNRRVLSEKTSKSKWRTLSLK